MGCNMAVFKCVIRTLQTRRRGFDYNFHNRVATDTSGLYAFWLNGGACLYVGIATDIRRRMREHRLNTHNSRLERFFNAFPEIIEVSYIGLSDCTENQLRDLERRTVRALRPLTNVALQN